MSNAFGLNSIQQTSQVTPPPPVIPAPTTVTTTVYDFFVENQTDHTKAFQAFAKAFRSSAGTEERRWCIGAGTFTISDTIDFTISKYSGHKPELDWGGAVIQWDGPPAAGKKYAFTFGNPDISTSQCSQVNVRGQILFTMKNAGQQAPIAVYLGVCGQGFFEGISAGNSWNNTVIHACGVQNVTLSRSRIFNSGRSFLYRDTEGFGFNVSGNTLSWVNHGPLQPVFIFEKSCEGNKSSSSIMNIIPTAQSKKRSCWGKPELKSSLVLHLSHWIGPSQLR